MSIRGRNLLNGTKAKPNSRGYVHHFVYGHPPHAPDIHDGGVAWARCGTWQERRFTEEDSDKVTCPKCLSILANEAISRLKSMCL